MAGRAATSAWAGALSLGGFNINLVAYSLLKSSSADSFKNLCACHEQPVVAPKRCSVDDTTLTEAQMLKGVARGRGKSATFVPVPADAVKQLAAAERTQTLEILRLPKADGIPWHLATGRYRLVPDPDVAGSAQPVEILWNGLLASERAVVSEWSKRAGNRPVLCVIRADVYGLTAIDLPYASSLKVDAPEHAFTENEQAQKMFEAFATQLGLNTDAFSHEAFTDTYAERRAELVEKALNGEVIVPEAAPVEAAPTVDLMAAMQAALEGAKAPAKKPAKKKAVKA